MRERTRGPSTPEPGQILEGDLFKEPMRVLMVRAEGPGRWTLGLVGVQTQVYAPVALTEADLERLHVLPGAPAFGGDPAKLRLGLQAYSLGIAYEFDPYF